MSVTTLRAASVSVSGVLLAFFRCVTVMAFPGAGVRAFSEEADTGSSKENAINQKLRAVDLIHSDRISLKREGPERVHALWS
jgi:hypothetical protein